MWYNLKKDSIIFAAKESAYMIKIGSIGYNHSHGDDFVLDCPNGPGAWLFLIMKSRAFMNIKGVNYSVKAGTVFVLEPDVPCRYGSDGENYTDDWCYFNMTQGDVEMLGKMGINTPLYLGSIDELSLLVYEITVEFYSSDIYHDEIVKDYTDIFFRRISRGILKKSAVEASPTSERRSSLANLRSRIYREPGSLPSVATLTEEYGVSISGLEHLYKKAFGTSVISDIIDSRVIYAKRLLLSSNILISEVAEKCGYNCCYSFMRQFKLKTGLTPTEFRKIAATGEGT